MDFEFSDDQQQLRDACARWVSKSYSFERRRAIVAEGGFSAQAYAELAELGLCALYVPDDQGGMGMGPVEGMVVMEELGRGMVLEPLVQTLMTSVVLTQYADAAVQQDWLSGMASGEQLVVLATLERKARYQLNSYQTVAQAVGDGWQLSGNKHLVSAGDCAHAYVVSAQAQGRLALFLVRADASGVRASGYATQDGSRAADVQFDAAPATLVTSDGLTALEHAVDVGIAALCAQGVGVMEQTLAATVDYMNTRKQFGVVIGSFQALRHRIADVKMQLELARSMSYFASLKLGEPAAQRRRAISQAKVQIGNSARYVGQQCTQLHGGIGVTDEYISSHYFKRLTMLEMQFGDTLHHLGEVSARMQPTAGVFA